MNQNIVVSDLLSPAKAAECLSTTPGTLAVWRSTKRYRLRYVKVGRKIMYRVEDIQGFIESRTQSGVAEPARDRKRKAS